MRRAQSLLLAIVALALTASIAHADDGLPPTRQLIKDTLALCNDPEEKYGSIHSMLAEAYVHLGDAPAARAILGEYKNDFWNQTAYQKCAALEIELSGNTTLVPDALWKDDPEFTHWLFAQAYARSGDTVKALEHASNLQGGQSTFLQLYGRRLVDLLLGSGNRDAARRVLLRWADCYAGTKSISVYHRPEYAVEHDIKLLGEFGDSQRARSFCEHWQSVVEKETDINEWGGFIGMSWARLGAAWSAAGDQEKAAAALGQGHKWLNVAKATNFDATQDLEFLNYGEAYAVVASRQRLLFGAEAARDAYEQAYDLAAQARAGKFEDFGFVKIVREQLKAGDVGGIPETMKRMLVLRHRTDAWRAVCEHYLVRSDNQAALTVARAAAAELDRGNLETIVARETANIAGCLAKGGDADFAKRLFQRAISLSERHDDSKFDHQWIAGQQVDAGFLADAYVTIQAIPEPQTRLIPLAELARAAAKREAQAKQRSP